MYEYCVSHLIASLLGTVDRKMSRAAANEACLLCGLEDTSIVVLDRNAPCSLLALALAFAFALSFAFWRHIPRLHT